MFVSCDFSDPDTGGGKDPAGGGNPVVDAPLSFTGTSGGKIVTITISQTDPSRVVLTPKSDDYYAITENTTLISKGKITITGSTWLFMPSSDSPGDKTQFNATYSNETLTIPSIPGTDISGLIATKGDGATDARPTLTGTVTIDSTLPKVGTTLTATYSDGNGTGIATWQWIQGNTPISNSNKNTYAVVPNDDGKTLKAQVSYANYKGVIESEATAAVAGDSRPTLNGVITFANSQTTSITPKVGDTITAVYEGYGTGQGTGTPAWQWLRDDTPISGAANPSYTVVNSDVGKTLKAQVSFSSHSGNVTSGMTAIVRSSGDNSPPTFTDTYTFISWLAYQPNNTKDTPYDVALNISSLSELSEHLKFTQSWPYISLDLSGSTFTSIEDGAFSKWTKDSAVNYAGVPLVRVKIPNGVTSIGNFAFSNCDLTNVTIPDSVISIGEYAFYANQLTSVTIPNMITSIADSTFYENKLTRVTIPDSVISIGNSAFSGNELTSLTIGNRVAYIGDWAFVGNRLTSVTIPNSVTSIGDRAFAYISGFGKSKLTSITLGNKVASIGEYAFAFNELASVTIPNSVTSIGEGAFAYNKLVNVSIPNNVAYLSGFNNNELTSITINNGVTSIGDSAFSNNELTSVTIPNSVTSIGEGAFAYNKLANITIPASVTHLSGFEGNRLTNIIIPDTVISIGDYALYGNELTSVTIGNKVTSIGDRAFSNNKLASVTIPASVTSIEAYAFASNQLPGVVIPDSVTSIGKSAFGANKLTNVTIPEKVTSIGNSAFFNNQLLSVTFKGTITQANFGEGAFDFVGQDLVTSIKVDLISKYLAGGIGTYTRSSVSSTIWTKYFP